ncbi:hypothetical protein DSM106972_092090 [Dulcicalothrix desertica PCC 7102]|uniref:Uncharacterized protein n=1 Tax=Dulcicalothrix desertica PCC 7102 TaxID=232991 RepID=A0A3S1C0T5_9CYAN|nr:hypothetical protein [Dulcicalothrix desertica]RUS94958.1 hypothetical protein DSM106972_092090 [Dulcicalothrix desertica PCC 7102]TWH62806.1 hypothetical protein CAL7102_00336 [Dulcicalothrix desertica PCC 7102]
MGKVIDLVNSKRKLFDKYKLWDVYSFSAFAIPSDCGSIGRVIDITDDYVVFGFRNTTSRRLKVVNLHPKDIHAKKIVDPDTQVRKRVFSLLENYSSVQCAQIGLESLLKLPDLTCEDVAFLNATEFFYKEYLPQVERSRFTVLE